MRCNADTLSRYADGELGLVENDRVSRHIDVCSSCRHEVEELQRVNQVLYAWGASRRPIPVATEQRVRSSLERRRRMTPLLRLARFSPPAVGSSIAALLLLLMVNVAPIYQEAAPVQPSATQVAPVIKRQAGPLQLARGRAAVVATEPDTLQRILVHHHFEALVN
jgi:predicted anti-sigma-YlaC factor YlaD